MGSGVQMVKLAVFAMPERRQMLDGVSDRRDWRSTSFWKAD